MTAKPLIDVVIRDRNGIVWQGQVRALSSYNIKGAFDVLPMHANFITLLKNRLVLHRTDGAKEEIQVDNGVMRAVENKVQVFVGVK